jgi:1,4-dihydroxy-2-naphthoate octaprenyltransferase
MITASSIKLLRIPFSFFLSPLYFFALSQVPVINVYKAILIFFILHFFIYPASNGYNSYMDRDTESIGGLEKPPPPSRQLYIITIILDTAGIALSWLISPLFALLILPYIGASKTYSYRGIRLKKYPIIGFIIVILFQGAFTFWLVYYGSSSPPSLGLPWEGMLISTFLIGGFFPLTQIYQHQQDLKDGVTSISYLLGYNGTFMFCAIAYTLAWALMTLYFINKNETGKLMMLSILFLPVVVYFINWYLQVKKNAAAANFRNTMNMTWLAATCTNIAFITLLIWRWFE